jgi:hypothetical protein
MVSAEASVVGPVSVAIVRLWFDKQQSKIMQNSMYIQINKQRLKEGSQLLDYDQHRAINLDEFLRWEVLLNQ